jgi:PadR family transcriptional regulator, regulatory protein PadR
MILADPGGEMGNEPPLLRDIQLAFIRIHILHHAAEHPIYGLWMRDELAEHGYDISVGTLYPILHQLEADGYLESDQRLHDGRRRRYYEATRAGHQLLAEIRRKLRELTDETLPTSPVHEP